MINEGIVSGGKHNKRFRPANRLCGYKLCAAAKRLGFSFEGIFRQATMYKGRNRDTAWYAVIDENWPAIKNAFEQWLSADNFDGTGHQIQSLGSIREEI